MPDIDQMKESKFLKKEEVGNGALLTIEACAQENVAKEGAEPELKWCLHFKEADKPMVLNQTIAALVAQITGQRNSDNWAGHKIVAYNDPSISFGGKITGGIRIRAPRGKAAQGQTAPAAVKPALPAENPIDRDDVPF